MSNCSFCCSLQKSEWVIVFFALFKRATKRAIALSKRAPKRAIALSLFQKERQKEQSLIFSLKKKWSLIFKMSECPTLGRTNCGVWDWVLFMFIVLYCTLGTQHHSLLSYFLSPPTDGGSVCFRENKLFSWRRPKCCLLNSNCCSTVYTHQLFFVSSTLPHSKF